MQFRTVVYAFLAALVCVAASLAADKDKPANSSDDQLVIAQLSDMHIGLPRAPEATQNMQRAVEMINDRHPDAVLVTGDIGENPQAWDEAKSILAGLKCANVFIIPGNHDDTANNVERWRKFWGPDYQVFHVKWATIIGLDSQLLGNFDHYDSLQVIPLSEKGQQESKKMLDWFADQIQQIRSRDDKNNAVFVMQHVPVSRAGGGSFPKDPKPYWAIQEPYRSREIELLHQLGVKDMFVGHWHIGMNYKADGIQYHVGPATSWSPFSDKLGFAMYTIDRSGKVKAEFVDLPGANAHRPSH